MKLTHASEQGMRSYQEDRLFIKRVKLTDDLGLFLAVMDGHRGYGVAQLCKDLLTSVISEVVNSNVMVQ